MNAYTPKTDLGAAIAWHLAHSVGKTPAAAQTADWRVALTRAVRDRTRQSVQLRPSGMAVLTRSSMNLILRVAASVCAIQRLIWLM